MKKKIMATKEGGSISGRCGPMFSNKSTWVHKKFDRAIIKGKRAVIIAYAHDLRYTKRSLCVSHEGIGRSAIRAQDLLEDPPEMPADVEEIFIDEAQFFKGLASFCARHYALGRKVRFAGLNSTFQGTSWPHMADLLFVIPHVRVKFCYAICIVCNKKAFCTRKIGGDRQKVEDIGGDEKYVPTCNVHFAEEFEIPKEIIERRHERIQFLMQALK